MSGEEDKIVYMNGDDVRVLRGRLDGEDERYIYLQRNDGRWRIDRDAVITIREVPR